MCVVCTVNDEKEEYGVFKCMTAHISIAFLKVYQTAQYIYS